MAIFLQALLWGLWILAALAGWGRLTGTMLRQDERPAKTAGWLEAPAWGIAFSNLAGGLLNLAGLAHSWGVTAFIFLGAALFFVFAAKDWRARERQSLVPGKNASFRILVTLALALLVFRFCSSVAIFSFLPYVDWAAGVSLNLQDDAQSYLVSPERMLQTGSLGQDPFNSRLMMSGLGGQHFLNAMMLAAFPPDYVHVADGGVGLAAACLAAAGLALRLGLGRVAAASFTLLPLAAKPLFVNISSNFTSLAVLIALAAALVRLLQSSDSKREQFGAVLLAGLLLAGACALKSTTIPLACLMTGLAFLWQAGWTRSSKPIGQGLAVGMGAVLCLAPWMLWQHSSSGTLLYPLLGPGNHVEVYSPTPGNPFQGHVITELKKGLVLPALILLLILGALASCKVRAAANGPLVAVAVGATAGWLVAWPVIALSTEFADVARYLAASEYAVLVVVLGLAWDLGRKLAQKTAATWSSHLGPAVLAVMLLVLSPEWVFAYRTMIPQDFAHSTAGTVYSWEWLTWRTHEAQARVPEGEKILAYLAVPFLLDFNRNAIYVADWPGESSPPPGLPVYEGPEKVAAYLRGLGIRYVMYAYASQANFDQLHYTPYLKPSNGRVVQRTTKMAFAFQDDLAALGQTRRRLYDDGAVYVLDLDQKTK